MNTPYQPIIHFHPGETLREKLEELSMSLDEFSKRTGYLKSLVSQVINGETDITQEMANRFESVLKIPSRFWIRKQSSYNNHIDSLIEDAKKWKYIYFETHMIDLDPCYIANFNVLTICPEDTDRHGIRINKIVHTKNSKNYCIIQHWLDLTKYDFEYQKNSSLSWTLMEALSLIAQGIKK